MNQTRLKNLTFVAFDTETSGAYPVGYDIVEFGAVKYRDGKEIDQMQFLLKPRELMTDFIIGIHGISNEMVQNCEPMSSKIAEVGNFFSDSVLFAHHAPFDMGFLAYEFEKANVPFPSGPILCTSLLSRKLIHGVPNHKLQTLIPFLGIQQGAAHRALDDARACLYVGLKSLEKLGPDADLEQALSVQEKKITWPNYEIKKSGSMTILTLEKAILAKQSVQITYDAAKAFRRITPIGIVRSPDGDFVYAHCERDDKPKRFYLEKIKQISLELPLGF